MANGALTGSSQGAAAGSSFGPYGAIIGGIAGGVSGGLQSLLGTDASNKRIRDYVNSMSQLQGEAAGMYGQNEQELNALYGRGANGYYNQNLNQIQALSDQARQELSGGVSAEDIQAQLSPQVDYQTKQATSALQGSYGNKGSLFSGAAGNAVAQSANNIANNAYNEAANRALANLQNRQAQSNANIANYGTLANTDIQGQAAQMGNRTDAMQTRQSYQDMINQANAQKKSGVEKYLQAFLG